MTGVQTCALPIFIRKRLPSLTKKEPLKRIIKTKHKPRTLRSNEVKLIISQIENDEGEDAKNSNNKQVSNSVTTITSFNPSKKPLKITKPTISNESNIKLNDIKEVTRLRSLQKGEFTSSELKIPKIPIRESLLVRPESQQSNIKLILVSRKDKKSDMSKYSNIIDQQSIHKVESIVHSINCGNYIQPKIMEFTNINPVVIQRMPRMIGRRIYHSRIYKTITKRSNE